MLTLQRMPMPRPSSKLTTKERNDLKWETHKHYIRSVYMDTDHTLKETMKIIGETHRFTARSVNISHNSTVSNMLIPRISERKWKEKLKEWKFEKNISAADMSVLVAKCMKRKRDEGKQTRFFHMGMEIKPEKFENFKKRKSTKIMMEAASPTAGRWQP